MNSLKKRWYDQDPELQIVINQLLSLSDDLQSEIAKGISSIVERDYDAYAKVYLNKSLSIAKISALKKANQKKRQYDANPNVHKALNYLSILNTQEQKMTMRHITYLMMTVLEYDEYNKHSDTQSSLKIINGIINNYIEKGIEANQVFLETLKKSDKVNLLR